MGRKVTIPGSSGITAEISQVTPNGARQWLAITKERNRSVSKNRIKRLSTAMERGEWVLGQPLLLDSHGHVLDGQHRLLAVIAYGKPVDFIVLRGLEREKTFARLDDGQPRKLHHWLHVRGEQHPDLLSPMIRMAYKHERNRLAFTTGEPDHITGPEGIAFLDSHPNLRRSAAAPGIVNRFAPRSLCGFLHYLFAEKDLTAANNFFVELVTGDAEAEDDPIYLLRERLRVNKYAKQKMTRIQVAALIIKAWNATRRGVKIERLQWQQEKEYFPEVA